MTGPDDPPIPMSQFTLGERYGAQDMYRDYPDLAPGALVSVEKDGVVCTDTIDSVSYTSPQPAPIPHRSRWSRLLRALTPRRWRKQLVSQPLSTGGELKITVSIGQVPRAQARLAEMGEVIEGLLSSKPDA